MRHFGFVAVLAALLIGGCGNGASTEAATDASVQSQSADGAETAGSAIELDWDDLMPEGEDKRLEEAFEEHFATLEADIAANSEMMTSMGPGSVDDIAEGSAFDAMPQLGTFNTVAELDGKLVRLPGFVVPLDFDARNELTEFLFVPYFGACIHTPPPPPNQIVYVKGEVSFEGDDIFAPYWAEGVLTASAQMSELGNAAYTLNLTELRPYEY